MSKIVHFEIHATDPERAVRFYKSVFGWEINEYLIPGVKLIDENRYWIVNTGPENEPGIGGGLMFRRGPAPKEGMPVNGFVCIASVDDLDKTVKKVEKSGGKITLGRMPVMGIGWVAYGIDTEGNVFGMLQPDPNAE